MTDELDKAIGKQSEDGFPEKAFVEYVMDNTPKRQFDKDIVDVAGHVFRSLKAQGDNANLEAWESWDRLEKFARLGRLLVTSTNVVQIHDETIIELNKDLDCEQFHLLYKECLHNG
jgi:hypothetical protein